MTIGAGLVEASDNGDFYNSYIVAMPDGQPNHWWRWIDSSSDGRVLVAVSQNGEVMRSTDSGTSWKSLRIAAGGATIIENEQRMRLSVSVFNTHEDLDALTRALA